METTRVCSGCGAENRIPSRHLAHAGKCGKCHAALSPSATPIDVDVAGFDDIIRESPVPVLVDFWATWCPPCRAAAPEVKKLAAEVAGQALVLKVDTDKFPELAQRYNIRGIPNFIVFRGGQLVRQEAGLVDHEVMQSWLG